MLEVLFATAAIGAIFAFLFPRYDLACSAAILGVCGFMAAQKTHGFDHENYLAMIESLRNPVIDLTERTEIARDPLFVGVVVGTEWLSPDPQWVFLLMSTLGVVTKWLAIRDWEHGRSLFAACYVCWLAPSLEFAAIRASVAIGFLMLAFSVQRSLSVACLCLAFLSHAQTITIVFIQLGIWALHSGRRAAVVLVAGAVGALAVWEALELRASVHDEVGTGNAFGIMAGTALLAGVAVVSLHSRPATIFPRPFQSKYQEVALVALASALLCLAVVPLSALSAWRLWEQSVALLLFALVEFLGRRGDALAKVHAAASLAACLALLSFFRFKGGTWAILSDFWFPS